MNKVVQPPRLIAWELTRACPLACRHCRASAVAAKDAAELSTAQCLKLIDNIVSFAKPTLILTGGEPLLRNDWFVIASYATSAGLPVALATCGLPVNDQSIEKMKQAGVRCVSISIDGAAAESHDAFRQKSGAFEACILAARRLRSAGMDFQVNTTVSRHNISELNEILKLAKSLGASVFNPFLLVPTGRAQSLANLELSADQYEQTLVWLAGQQDARIQIRVTCAPHYQRIIRQLGLSAGAHAKGGCLGGKSFAFISHVGEVQICGFLDVSCGDLRTNDMNFAAIWRNSPVLQRIRDVSSYGGKCGCCEYVSLCGGCRARANAVYGDWLAQEPFCTYQPGKASPDENDLVLMNAAQVAIPPVSRPFEALGGMAAIVGLDVETVRGICEDATESELSRVDVANHNEDVQTVISGDVSALERAMVRAKELQGKAIRQDREPRTTSSPICPGPSRLPFSSSSHTSVPGRAMPTEPGRLSTSWGGRHRARFVSARPYIE